MRIKEGDPLELYIDSDYSVTFKKYNPIRDQDYDKAKQLMKAILPNEVHFALYDLYGDIREATSLSNFNGEHRIVRDEYIPNGCYEIRDCGTVGYLYIKGDIAESVKQMAVDVLTAFYKED